MLNLTKSGIFVCTLLLIISCCLPAQTRFPNLKTKLEQLKTKKDIKVKEIEKGIYKLQYPNGKTLIKNTNDYKLPPEAKLKFSPDYDSTIINLINIDTLPYYQKYSFWQEVPLTNFEFSHILIGDVNNNGKPELYGARKFYQTDTEPVTVYETDNISGIFEDIHQYDSVYRSRNIYDVDDDGVQEVQLLGIFDDERFFSKESYNSLATIMNFSFNPYPFPSQKNDMTLGKFDNDNFSDLLFIRFSTASVYIFEYNPIINNFDSVYNFEVNGEYAFGGFSVGDFDLDGKTDMVCATMQGNVYVIENEGDNQYTNSWQGMVETFNAYIHTWTHDVDKNGKPEFWVLGDATYYGIPKTRITLFETDGDNSYQAVGRIDLIGVFSFYAGTMQAIDIDNDGIDEVAVCIDDNFLILKFNGKIDHQNYEVYYIKKNELSAAGENSVYYGAIMYDLLYNGKKNILISMDQLIEQGGNAEIRFFTQIYKPDSTTGVDYNIHPASSFNLFQNYPNPFNPITNIKFSLGNKTIVSIRVYNILGKEIKLLLKEELPSGEHEVQWDGKDNSNNVLPSGIYLVQMRAGSYQKTIKTTLLK